MAQNTRISCTAGQWTQLTDADVSGDVSVMLATYDTPVYLQAMANTDTPSGTTGPLELLSRGDGWSEATIAEKFPGVASAVRLWAYPYEGRDAVIGISHG